MLIGDLHSSTLIGCFGKLNQSEWGIEDTEGAEGVEAQLVWRHRGCGGHRGEEGVEGIGGTESTKGTEGA